jgi:uncharacterized membrane protein YfcA
MLGLDTVFTSLPQLLLSCAILTVAEAVYVTLGFGAGLIAVGGLALLLPELRDVVVLLLLVNLPAELWVVWASRRHIVWRGVFVLFAGIAVGIPLGTWLLRWGNPEILLTALGVLLVAVGAAFLNVPPAHRLRTWPAWVAPPVGVLSGLLTGLFGTGGPPLVLYYQLGGAGKAAFRGHLMAIFLLMTTVRVPSYAAFGLITPTRLWSALLVLPAVLLGAFIGNRIHLELNEETFRRLVSGGLVVIGLLLLIPNG